MVCMFFCLNGINLCSPLLCLLFLIMSNSPVSFVVASIPICDIWDFTLFAHARNCSLVISFFYCCEIIDDLRCYSFVVYSINRLFLELPIMFWVIALIRINSEMAYPFFSTLITLCVIYCIATTELYHCAVA